MYTEDKVKAAAKCSTIPQNRLDLDSDADAFRKKNF
ncbi:hypothetical protein NTE_00232 [Candidatus Nitrososphaera evergladensis SR1]|uniref:Uncharacterized protein n=1 Tax=Candidatus Nitrososphaera evergladensis SR1 TaxID=1459636 RepID=A0A075MSJ0_9ARCH|nr:hypothetical protein NTE_00232 [Candidatus Nitrososphaera evergladensis SR1]